MQAVKILLLCLMIVTIKVDAKSLVLASAKDIANQLQLKDFNSWAINGGVFKKIDDGLNDLPAGVYQILIKDAQGKVSVHDIRIQGQIQAQLKENILVIDDKGPEIDLTWLNTLENGEEKIVGPESRMRWQIVDEYSKNITLLINDQPVDGEQSIGFSQDSSQITVKASDYFGNESIKQQQLIADFKGPQLNWELLNPAIKKNDKWLAGSKVQARVDAIDDFGVDHITINGNEVDGSSVQMSISNNSILVTVDKLGNTKMETISWEIDDKKPRVTVKIDGQTLDSKRHKYIVNTNQDIFLAAEDNTSLKYAKYFSVDKQWESLPKNFTFHKRGRNSIKVIAEDQFGNILKTKLKFRAKNDGKK